MLMRPFPTLGLLLGLLLLVTGCAGSKAGSDQAAPPPMRLSDFYGFCSSLPTPDACVSGPLCGRYRQALATAPADLSACLALCQRLENELYDADLVNGCEPILDRAQDLCDQYCRRRDRP